MFNVKHKDTLFVVQFSQACCRFDLHFMSVLKIIHRSPSSHYKVIYMNCFVMPTSLTKYASCSTWKNLRHQVWSSFCVSSVFCIQVAWQSWWQFWVVANSLLGNLTSVKYIVILCNLEISTFKLTICLFYPMATSLIFCIVCVSVFLCVCVCVCIVCCIS